MAIGVAAEDVVSQIEGLLPDLFFGLGFNGQGLLLGQFFGLGVMVFLQGEDDAA